ncbi:hypothetical protein GR160_08175 [Flavobacterium sp. Sd200]|uniref:hypothetical protein n=1 Tax=Flavobacterium sp. Sd200 TaxID=2692211 RepID=UPI00136D78F1|nr:hypothetical protein [Flavobacterium sp. Sd200]MXN91203.1 hypothetical protein [Flavobacterium sp. Sd200]
MFKLSSTLKLLLPAVIIMSHKANAQAKDTTATKKIINYATDKFPITRFLNVEFNQVAPFTIKPKLYGSSLPERDVEAFNQARVSANINFIKSKQWIVGTTLLYRYMHSETEYTNPLTNIGVKDNFDYHYYSASLNITHFSRLAKKPVIYSASIIPDGGNEGIERVRGFLSATIVLKADAKTKMTVGLLGFIDRSAQTPVIPSFSYERKLNNGWIVDVILPKQLFMKKNMFTNGRLSLGTELDATMFYLYDFNGDTSNVYQFNQLEINSGLTYEHCIGPFIATLKTGFKSIPTSRVLLKNDKNTDYVFEAKSNGAFYLNLGVSFNPKL